MFKQREKERLLEAAVNGELNAVQRLGGILGFKMKIIVGGIGAGNQSILPDVFALNIPFPGRERGWGCILCKF